MTEAPTGGIKNSSVGLRHGVQGIRKFCRQRTVVVDRFGSNKEFNWYPTGKRKAALFRRALSFFRSGFWNKLRSQGLRPASF